MEQILSVWMVCFSDFVNETAFDLDVENECIELGTWFVKIWCSCNSAPSYAIAILFLHIFIYKTYL